MTVVYKKPGEQEKVSSSKQWANKWYEIKVLWQTYSLMSEAQKDDSIQCADRLLTFCCPAGGIITTDDPYFIGLKTW